MCSPACIFVLVALSGVAADTATVPPPTSPAPVVVDVELPPPLLSADPAEASSAEAPPTNAAPADASPVRAGKPTPASSTKKTAPSSSSPTPTPSRAVDAVDPLVVAALQLLVPCGVLVVSGVVSAVVPFGSLTFCVLPAAGGYLTTWIGDRLGGTRAAAVWTMLASYVPCAGLGLAGLLSVFVVSGVITTNVGAATIGVLGVVAASMLSLALPPAVYRLTSQPRSSDDDGSALPGLFTPYRPPSVSPTAPAATGAAVRPATRMRF